MCERFFFFCDVLTTSAQVTSVSLSKVFFFDWSLQADPLTCPAETLRLQTRVYRNVVRRPSRTDTRVVRDQRLLRNADAFVPSDVSLGLSNIGCPATRRSNTISELKTMQDKLKINLHDTHHSTPWSISRRLVWTMIPRNHPGLSSPHMHN